MLQIVGHNTV